MHRRRYLLTAAAGTAAVAGCLGAGDDEPTDDTSADDGNGSGGSGSGGSGSNENGSDDNDDDDGSSNGSDGVEPGTFDDFSDPSLWSIEAGTMSIADDRSYTDSPALMLEAGLFDDQIRLSRSFDDPLDLTGLAPGLALATDGDVNPDIQLTDSDGDQVEYRGRVRSDLPLMRCQFGVNEVVGDPDLSDITSIQITAWAGDGKEKRFWCDDLHFVPKPDTGTVLLQFDYGREAIYEDVYPVLRHYDLPATAFVNTDFVGAEGRMDEDQLTELQDDGWVIGSQGPTQMSLTEVDDPDATLEASREWLEEHGFEEGANYLSYPLGRYDANVLEAAGSVHDLAFGGGRPGHGYLANPQLCPRIGNPDADRARDVLERTAEWNGITTIYYNDLGARSLAELQETVADIRELVDDGDLEVALPGDLTEYVYE
ncbi:polysaccharide deacetylase family protein [Halobacteria archaeon AArc-dxtr1]|nr:polysaccharide deacetylase family protein [Halobacteria archaeon AArc-dxtr1]